LGPTVERISDTLAWGLVAITPRRAHSAAARRTTRPCAAARVGKGDARSVESEKRAAFTGLTLIPDLPRDPARARGGVAGATWTLAKQDLMGVSAWVKLDRIELTEGGTIAGVANLWSSAVLEDGEPGWKVTLVIDRAFRLETRLRRARGAGCPSLPRFSRCRGYPGALGYPSRLRDRATRKCVELRELGRFEVGARVGGGGMADVYVGRAPDKDGRDELVAIKVIRDVLGSDPKYLGMFSDEAKLLALLSHPNLIRTIEYGVAKDRGYIVMELLAGRSLLEVCEALVASGEALPIRLGGWICARVADGLHAAHELTDARGASLAVIHRDVNPSNIFLTNAGEVKLIDFGLAKAKARRTTTRKGIVKGTVAYIAPESVRPSSIDRRVDIFALGTTLWEIGTMQRLFRRETVLETVQAIVASDVPDPRSIVTGYPNELWAVVQRALKRDRDERYPTAAVMRDDLDALVASTAPISASAISTDMSRELAALVTRLFPT
jgi:hypothetical protein